MLPTAEWSMISRTAHYAPASLTEEGFIHCTAEPEMLVTVANRFYVDQRGPFVILKLAVNRIQAPIRWEATDDWLFPHVYGPLNLDAVMEQIAFPRDDAGRFLLPPDLGRE